MKLGSFTAASNVTGVMTDVDAVTKLLHEHGVLAFWDYATAAAHVRVDMNPSAGQYSSVIPVFLAFLVFHGWAAAVVQGRCRGRGCTSSMSTDHATTIANQLQSHTIQWIPPKSAVSALDLEQF